MTVIDLKMAIPDIAISILVLRIFFHDIKVVIPDRFNDGYSRHSYLDIVFLKNYEASEYTRD